MPQKHKSSNMTPWAIQPDAVSQVVNSFYPLWSPPDAARTTPRFADVKHPAHDAAVRGAVCVAAPVLHGKCMWVAVVDYIHDRWVLRHKPLILRIDQARRSLHGGVPVLQVEAGGRNITVAIEEISLPIGGIHNQKFTQRA